MTSYTALLTAIKAESHIHLIIGSNPLASTRCGQSLSVGACPVLLAPETPELHCALQDWVDDGHVRWVKEPFRDSHLFTLGRADVNHVVDAVFVTSNSGDSQLGK
jgi:uroporphyrin-III C-methyltransferase